MGFSGDSLKNPPANAGDTGSIPRLGRFPGEGNGYPPSILAWEIPWTEEPSSYSSWGHKQPDTTEQLSTHARTIPSVTHKKETAEKVKGNRSLSYIPADGGLWTTSLHTR